MSILQQKMADGWDSKKLWVFMMAYGAGVGLALAGLFTWDIGAFLLSLPVAYGVLNVKNKAEILKHTTRGGNDD